MRLVKIPAVGEGDFDHARIHQAERRFLESLQAEAARSGGRGRTVKVSRSSAGAARGRGAGLGSAYARLNGNMRARDLDRAAVFADAIGQGLREAQRRDEIDAELLNSSEHLESMGFHGFGPQRDDDF